VDEGVGMDVGFIVAEGVDGHVRTVAVKRGREPGSRSGHVAGTEVAKLPGDR
jgi:hypothetical protein